MAALLGAVALAQEAQPAFEVASIKRSPDVMAMSIYSGVPVGDRWLVQFATLPMVLRSIYGANYQLPGQIVGGPSWFETDRFHISAKFQGNPPNEQLRVMALNLLADRFSLKTHVESRELPAYRLELLRSDRALGPQLRRIDVDCEAHLADQRRAKIPPAAAAVGAMPLCVTGGNTAPISIVESGGISMAQFANRISTHAKRPVVDRTGLAGYFTLKLEFAWEQPLQTSGSDVDNPAPLLAVALQSQLGLRFRDARERYQVLVIDSVKQPTED